MWCEEFMSAYRDTPLERLPEHYDRTSVFVDMAGVGGGLQWKRPATGARDIADRMIELNVTTAAGEWGMVACQWLRADRDGLIAVLSSADGDRLQVLIVHRSVAATPVVRVHFHVDCAAAVNDSGGGAPSFRQRFEDWATSLDAATATRHGTAMHAGLYAVRDFYASPGRRRADCDRSRWRQYDPAARFTCTRTDGTGGGRVHVGPRSIRKRYERLALDHRNARLRSIECYGSSTDGGCDERVADYSAVLVTGSVPDMECPGDDRAHRQFVQLLVVDTRTRKIINDVLCFLQRPRSTSSSSSSSSLSLSSSCLSTSAPSTLHPPRAIAVISSGTSDDFLSSSTDDPIATCGNDGYDYCGDFIQVRSRITDHALKIRSSAAAITVLTTVSRNNHQQVVQPKINPRQLFIGCVPLHVKYGQLKLLFERFGEVTFVKVYDGYSKQTGAKMLHNYAFLFFKDEESAERAIAASPVPLDDTWNLKVSRPHHYTAAVAASGLYRA